MQCTQNEVDACPNALLSLRAESDSASASRPPSERLNDEAKRGISHFVPGGRSIDRSMDLPSHRTSVYAKCCCCVSSVKARACSLVVVCCFSRRGGRRVSSREHTLRFESTPTHAFFVAARTLSNIHNHHLTHPIPSFHTAGSRGRAAVVVPDKGKTRAGLVGTDSCKQQQSSVVIATTDCSAQLPRRRALCAAA